MDKKEFWQVVDSAKLEAKGDQALQAQLLSKALATHTSEQIIEFECRLREYLVEADDFTVMAALKIIDGYVSDDNYLYFRCWLIGQGEALFAAVLQAPDTLAGVMTEPYQEFEELLYVTTTAFAELTGKEEDETFPREAAAARGFDYESAAGTKGDDWNEEQLPKMLPRLWKKFGPI
ncbi:DUF4240 domain-containing protein [Hymenobacter sp. BT175]|uniref:DUF4240 domain-containing protein n=1 Tax=Hymenobacter translucens TaxID=2886507 RepID=UPI001D0EE359|nr:DUF4240 domain-containing protein [Hymenobacter translucens]MCC2547319.1 DUF4240 domain-containing protein [Hymenobacter translucens]